MERFLAGLFAEGTSYLANAWTNASSNAGQKATELLSGISGSGKLGEDEPADKERSTTHESAVSTSSSSSRTSTASASSAKKISKVVGWMVFGSKKKRSSSCATAEEAPDCHGVSNKKTALDILLAASVRPYEQVDPATLRAVSVVGRGGYGKVMLMRSQESGKLVAVKEVAKANLIDKPGSTRSVRPVSTKIEHAEMERMVLGSVGDHPFITSFHGSFQNRNKVFLMLEYIPGGELFGMMQRQGVFPEARVRLYVAEIVLALEFLHDKGIIYRDLKPENILIDADGHIRLTDFGLSIAFNKLGDDNSMRCYSICGTPEYISPEIVLGATTRKNDRSWSYGKTVDWWALGVLTYEMLYRVPPFFHRERKTMLNKILECNLQFPKPSAKLGPVSLEANDFISSLLKFEEANRLGFGNAGSANVKAHPFFKSLDWNEVGDARTIPDWTPELSQDADTSNFDATFTKELLREDNCSKCAYNLELTGFDYLPEGFQEAVWYQPPAQPAPELGKAAPTSTAPPSVSNNHDDAAVPPVPPTQTEA